MKRSLRECRKSTGMRLEEVAFRLRVSATTVSNWESGRTEPSVSQAKMLSSLYRVQLDDIYFPIKSN